MRNRTPYTTAALLILGLFAFVFSLGFENLNSAREVQQDLLVEAEKLQNNNEHIESELSDLADTVQDLQDQKNELNVQMVGVRDTAISLQKKEAETTAKLESATKQAETLATVTDKLSQKLKKESKTVEALKNKKAQAKQTVNNLKAEYKKEKEKEAAREAAERRERERRKAAAKSRNSAPSSGSQTNSSGNNRTIERIIYDVFGPTHGPNAVKIARCESGLNPKTSNYNDPHGGSHGIFQINGVHGYSRSQLYDPAFNARVAKKLFDSLGGRFGTTRGWFNCANKNGIY